MTLKEVLIGDYFTNHLSPYELRVIKFITLWVKGEDHYTVFTSGSTGKPKSIEYHRNDLIQSAQRTIEYFNLTINDTALLCLDIKHIGGMMMLVRCLVAEMNLIVQEPNANPIGILRSEEYPTFVAMVPLQLQNYLSIAAKKGLRDAKAIIVGGGPLSMALKNSITNLDTPVYQTFGMTETVSHVAVRLLNGMNSTDVYGLLDGWKIMTDEEGRLMIKPKEVSNWIHTNDVVELIDDKTFKWLGRSDNVINSGGVKIHPESLETSIQEIFEAMGLSRKFFIIGLPDLRLGEKVVMVVEGDTDTFNRDSILSELNTQLPKYTAPKQILYSDHFVETENGKVKRRPTLEAAYLKR